MTTIVHGPCGEGCGCTTPVPGDGQPVACSLGADEMDARITDWQAVLETATERQLIPGGVRLTLASSAPIATIAELAAAEHGCCPFLAFAITVDARGVALEVSAPAEGQELLHELFGAPR